MKIYEAWDELYDWLLNQDEAIDPMKVIDKMDVLEEMYE